MKKLHCAPHIARVTESRNVIWGRHLVSMSNANKILIDKIKNMILLGVPKNSWDNNIKMDIRAT
jgi:hypothetical protein